MIDLRQLEALVALHRHGTVSAAAQALGYSQPTVSHHLSALARVTGTVLFTRVGRGVRLTQEGRALARRGEEILALMDRAEREATAMARADAGRLRLAAFPSAVASFVPAILAALGECNPGLTVELVDAEPPEALDALSRGTVDAALSFAYGDSVDGPRGTEAVALLDDPLFLVAAPGGITDIADGGQCRWITGCQRCHEKLAEVARAAGFVPDVAYASDDYVAVQALVAAGLGASLLPGMALRAYRHPGVDVRPVAGERRHVGVVVERSRPRPLAIDALVDACRRAAPALQSQTEG
ncbi:MAG: LysR family transcriptional regulator [Actinomycetaceae bacterium]|nr:LysR family transcriptional regulator [Actinomycetaceae bacterium]